ncbi:MAG: hypothetical protein A2Y10_16015 [Planctomycetes bacterium GWF2_41_51]|nr:MAG: hypothetical protein A2Y10_16015 [Planctomycetes bacterium GWF2_41_51]HBG25643.1 hypothetical protein [Phycisphaerales bacterium]
MKKKIFYVIIFTASLFFTGCTYNRIEKANTMNEIIKAVYSEQTINVDGVLDEPVWKKAAAYPLYLSKDKIADEQKLNEAGEVRFAWDDNFFYVAASFQDTDIVAQGKEDNMHHYQYGDLCELFLKPANESYYWELYVMPAGKKTSFFYPSKGYLGLPGCIDDYKCDLKVAAQCQGTLNNWHDKDKSWTAEMAMPIKDLRAYGASFSPQAKWKILVGRYNYSRYLDHVELSMTPQLSKTSYHLYEEYADLELIH